jgi:putative nucleotidyltransferase with HDIG domain
MAEVVTKDREQETLVQEEVAAPVTETEEAPEASDFDMPPTDAEPGPLPDYGMAQLKPSLFQRLAEVNKELWIILSLLIIAAVMNYLVTAQRMVLGFYTLPTLFSAYFFGRRHATLTAFASVFVVGLLAYVKPDLFSQSPVSNMLSGYMYDMVAWGGMLVITGYTMGTLYERHKSRVAELQQTYHGMLHILRHFISKDKYTENHCYRVSIYAAKIAAYLGFNMQQVEDVRASALLHDIGKLEISRQLLYKAAQLSKKEFEGMKEHVAKGASLLSPIASGPLHRIIPIILAHHDRFDGSGYTLKRGESIPLEARVIAVADVYDALTSDRPYRKAMSPLDAKNNILKGSGTEFDPKVIKAFELAFQSGEMEVPEIYL